MLRNNEHQYQGISLPAKCVFGCFKSALSVYTTLFFAVTFHSALLLLSPSLTILQKDNRLKLASLHKKKKGLELSEMCSITLKSC